MAVLNLNPETFTAGALINDVDAKIVSAEFRMFTYPNSTVEPSPVLAINIATSDDEKHEQVYTVGPADKFRPSENGQTIEVLTPGASVSRNSNLGIFIKSLVDAGFDASKLNDGKASAFVGLNAHFIRKSFGKNANGKDKEVLVVDRLIAGGASNAPAASGNSTATASASDPAADFVVETLNMVIAEAGGTLDRKQILAKFMVASKGNALQKDGLKLVTNNDFINKNFEVNGTEIGIKG